MTETSQPIPLIFDDDGSQDGMTALAYMLANPKFDVQAITVANGIARPDIFDENIKRMLGRLGDTDIPVGVGRSTPLAGNNEFPDFIRDGSDTFWFPFVDLPEEVPDIESQSAVDLIIDTVNNSPEPVAILATGPLTNIAEALRQDPDIIDNISVVQIMGGAVFVEGNLPVLPEPPFSTNEVGEFNIWVDPVAAQEVFDAGERGLKIQLTPLDATNQIEFDRDDYTEWLETATPESEIAAEFLDYALEVIQSDNDPNPVWDLVAAINLAEPDFSPETPLHIDVDTEADPGDSQGQTLSVEGLPPNVLVSLDPSFDNIPFDGGETFSYLELPVVNLSADRTEIVEGGAPQLLSFHLSEPAPIGGLTVNINIDDPDGEGADTEFPPELISNIVDFGQVEEDGIITASLTIAEGATEATFGISAIADDVAEGEENYSLTLLADENYQVDTASTTIITTIEEVTMNEQMTTVSLTPETLIATEGETFAWNFSLDAPAPEGGLSLFLPITVNNDPAPGDVDYNIEGSSNIDEFEFVVNNDVSVGLTFTIDEGATEATLVSEAIADEVTEIDEIATFVLADGENYRANPEQDRVNLVLTEFPVVSLDTEEITAAEGDTFAWDFSLNQPAPEGGLSLFLPVTANNDPAPGDVDYNVEGSSNINEFEFVVEDGVSIGFNLTIAEGATSASLVSEVVADDVEEGTEIFTTVIADGEDYRVNPAQSEVVTTLTESDATDTTSDTSTSVSLELDDLVVSAQPGVADVTLNLDYIAGIEDSQFIDANILADSIENYLANEPSEGDFFEVVAEDLTQFLATDADLGLSELAESITVELDGEPYAARPFPFIVESTALIETIDTSTDLPTISVFAEPTQVEEGSQLLWNFSLTEAVGNGGLTVALDLVEDTDPLPGDINYFVDGSENVTDFELIIDEESGLIEQALVTLAEGATEATLVNDIIADNATEGEESVSFALAESDKYSVDSDVNAASFTILDTSVDSSDDVMDVIDLTSFTVEVSATSNAGFTNIGGFYQAVDTEGTVIDSMTGEEVSPGDAGYEAAALANSVVELGDGEDATLELDGGFDYIPYLLANGTRFFTAFESANADGLDHVQSIDEDTFGFEDLLGGGDNDFNDYIISFDIV